MFSMLCLLPVKFYWNKESKSMLLLPFHFISLFVQGSLSVRDEWMLPHISAISVCSVHIMCAQHPLSMILEHSRRSLQKDITYCVDRYEYGHLQISGNRMLDAEWRHQYHAGAYIYPCDVYTYRST